ncbi:hypothetical protein MMC13_003384 [Lambiella insularis]|nr:hypothetical protein [Lambiella insularis]
MGDQDLHLVTDELVSDFAYRAVIAIRAIFEAISTQSVFQSTESFESYRVANNFSWKMSMSFRPGTGPTYQDCWDLSLRPRMGSQNTIDHSVATPENVAALLSRWHLTVKTCLDAAHNQKPRDKPFLRVVHSGFVSDGQGARKFMKLGANHVKAYLGTNEYDGYEEFSADGHDLPNYAKWPVFGSSYLPNFRHPRSDPEVLTRLSHGTTSTTKTRRASDPKWIHPSADVDENSFVALRGLTLPEMRALLKKDFGLRPVIAVPEPSLIRACALEFVTVFLAALTKHIRDVGGTERSLVSAFHHLAKAILASRLVDTVDEALTMVVPAFVAGGLVPGTP